MTYFGELSFLPGGGGASVCGGTRIFWGVKGGGQFFSVGQRMGGGGQDISSYFFSTLDHSHFNLITAPSIVCVRGVFFHWRGGRIFFPNQKGGPEFFRVGKGGPKFVYVCKGGGE